MARHSLAPRTAAVCAGLMSPAWRAAVRNMAGRAGRRQRRVVVYSGGPGSGPGGAGSGIMGALALAGLAAGAVVMVLVGSVVVVVIGVAAVVGLACIRFLPVRHPVLRSIQGAMMMRSQHKQVRACCHRGRERVGLVEAPLTELCCCCVRTRARGRCVAMRLLPVVARL